MLHHNRWAKAKRIEHDAGRVIDDDIHGLPPLPSVDVPSDGPLPEDTYQALRSWWLELLRAQYACITDQRSGQRLDVLEQCIPLELAGRSEVHITDEAIDAIQEPTSWDRWREGPPHRRRSGSSQHEGA